MAVFAQEPLYYGPTHGCDVNATGNNRDGKIVYWHRELPPLDADLMAEHTVEASSSRVPGTIAQRNELWDQCYRELIAANIPFRLCAHATSSYGTVDEVFSPYRVHAYVGGNLYPDRQGVPLRTRIFSAHSTGPAVTTRRAMP